ncbi:MAG TPA: aromatic amino acid transport family protein [Candidatus Paceibacterota bacterium]|nr:aromatic amino acid transport family protein [Candidatus Paceibacterota bacterium]
MLPAYFRDRKFYHAAAVLVGTMVGAGMFGIPFAFAKAGFFIGTLWLIAIAAVMCVFNLLFAELTLSTEGHHQVSGYARIWLGAWGRRFTTLANVLSIYGALLAYLIIFGEFAHNILSQYLTVNPELYAVIFAVGWSVLWLVRVRTMATVESGLIVIYTTVIALIAALGLPHVHLANLSSGAPMFWFLPYGVLLFAFSGMSAVPIQRTLLAGRERLMKPAIVWAMALTAVLYIVFASVVVGISGGATSPEALSGLYGLLGTPVILIGSALGLLTVSTSYIALGTALWESFTFDYRTGPLTAWLLTLVPPLVFFWSGLRNFIDVIGLVGAVAGGLLGVVILSSYLRARKFRLRTPEFRIRFPTVAVWLMMAVYIAGMVYELVAH